MHATAQGHARAASLSAAGATLDAELRRSAGEEHFALMLRSCARGGCATLDAFCAVVGDSTEAVDEAPALRMLAAMSDEDAVDRAFRAATWAMAAQRISSSWPRDFYAMLELARTAMPLDDRSFEHMQNLGALTACANTTEQLDTRDGQRMQFSRESLEHVIGAATGHRPVRRDLLHVIAPWTACFVKGIRVCEAHLRELEGARSDALAS
ncbi:MAG: hypothetical protein QOI73_464 [Solirubrobacteraceae bacterium]|nr:hypothetical protein [Solirubrobacteraceae bacterium]